MNKHLSQDQMAMWIVGRCTPEEFQHGHECALCSAELARFETPISTFRGALQEWSFTMPAPNFNEVTASQRNRFGGTWRWAASATLAAALTAILLLHDGSAPQPGPAATDAVPEQWTDDTELMHAIAVHLSRPVPAAMEPIFVLVPATDTHLSPGGHDESK
jgi:hypothetical protein